MPGPINFTSTPARLTVGTDTSNAVTESGSGAPEAPNAFQTAPEPQPRHVSNRRFWSLVAIGCAGVTVGPPCIATGAVLSSRANTQELNDQATGWLGAGIGLTVMGAFACVAAPTGLRAPDTRPGAPNNV